MAIRANNVNVIDDNRNANVTHMNISYYGEVVADSVTSPTTTPPHSGTVAAYYAGGVLPSVPVSLGEIERILFATGGQYPSGIVGTLRSLRRRGHSGSSDTHGYVKGGDATTAAVVPAVNVGFGYFFSIEKFPFASGSAAIVSTVVGDMVLPRSSSGGGVASPTHAYSGSARVGDTIISDIERFPFASEGLSQRIGTSSFIRNNSSEFASLINGYTVSGTLIGAGSPTTVLTTTIQKFNFSADADATYVGDVSVARHLMSGLSANVSGYTASGVSFTPTVRYKTIDKFNYATEGTATFVGDLTSNNGSTTASTSSIHGYILGGAISNNPPAPVVATGAIDRFPFATDQNAVAVGALTANKIQGFGCQD